MLVLILQILGISPILVSWGLMFPVGFVYLEGIRSAREPAHRVTPLGPWFYFDRVVRTRLRIWPGIMTLSMIFLSLLLVALMEYVLRFIPRAYSVSSTSRWDMRIVLFGEGIIFALLIYSSLQVLAPRVRRLWLLMTCAGALSCSVFIPIMATAALIAARHLTGPTVYPGNHDAYYGLMNFHVFTLCSIVLALALRTWARRQGEAWFRFPR